MNNFALMARFNRWANERLYDTVSALPSRFTGATGEPSSARSTTGSTTLSWTGCGPAASRAVTAACVRSPCPDLTSLRRARNVEDEALLGLVDGLSDERLAARVTYRQIIGDGIRQAEPGHILLGLFNHQIAARSTFC